MVYLFASDSDNFHEVVNGIRRKWRRSDSSDSDSVALMTLLTTSQGHRRSYDSDSVAINDMAVS